jgi:hypothetical protein
MSITIPATEIIPDHVAAVVARLRRFTNVTDLCPDETVAVTKRDGTAGTMLLKRVSANMEAVTLLQAWTGHAVVVNPSGGLGDDPYVPLGRPRFDCLCYGTNGYEAARLARVVASVLVPVGRRGSAFTEAQCRLSDVQQVSDIINLGIDRENQAHRRVVSFEATKKLIPVGVV